MPQQKVLHQVSNYFIDEMITLIHYQCEGATKTNEYVFIYEPSDNNCGIGAKRLCLHPFGGVICCHQDIFFTAIPPHEFDRTNKIYTPIHEKVS